VDRFGFIRALLVFGGIIVLSVTARAEDPYSPYFLKKDSFASQLNELRNEFATNKIIPSEIETECLAALSFYPELKDVAIEFRFGHIKSTMLARPKVNSLVYSRENRRYVVIINNPRKDNPCTLSWDELSFNALTGWIGHELGHIVYYTGKSSPGIVVAGMRYLHPEYKKSMERETDMTTIRHNMGFALYEGLRYTFCCSRASAGYKAGLKKYYLSLDEIVQHSSVRIRINLHKKDRAERAKPVREK
jgi:hypothetical protein